VGGTLVDGTGAAPVPDAVVLVSGGKITCAGAREDCPVPPAARVIDASGKWITPGLIDAHVHFSQTGWADGRPDALDVRDRYPYAKVVDGLERHPERFFRADLCAGVTAVFDVGGYPWTLDLPGRTEGDPDAPRVTAAGPLLSTWDFWLNLPAERQFVYLADEAAAKDGVAYLAARGAHAVKLWFIPTRERPFPEMEKVALATGRAARAAGLPLIVHATGLREAKVALEAGASILVHSVDDAPVDQEFLDRARGNGTIYCPTLTVGRGYLRLYRSAVDGEPPEIDDPNGCVDAETRAKVAETAKLRDLARAKGLDPTEVERYTRIVEHRERQMAENLMAVHKAGIPIAMGTDAGNPLTLHGPAVYPELEAMEAAGLTPMEVLEAATRGGARALGRSDELGTVEKGKLADLLVLGADPTKSAKAFRAVELVVRGGTGHRVADLAQHATR
jgi:imidazolonepropionase-like amidohydrolase